jgi:hypothetical protein
MTVAGGLAIRLHTGYPLPKVTRALCRLSNRDERLRVVGRLMNTNTARALTQRRRAQDLLLISIELHNLLEKERPFPFEVVGRFFEDAGGFALAGFVPRFPLGPDRYVGLPTKVFEEDLFG